jgi:hypothetical protein
MSAKELSILPIPQSNPAFDAADNPIFHGLIGISPVRFDSHFAVKEERDFAIRTTLHPSIKGGQSVTMAYPLDCPASVRAERAITIKICE